MTLSDYVKREDSREVVSRFLVAWLTPGVKDRGFTDEVAMVRERFEEEGLDARESDLADALIERLRGIWEER